MRPGHSTYIRILRGNYVTLAEILLAEGDYEATAQAADKFVPLAPQSWETYYDTACMLSRCVGIIQNDKRLTDPRRRELANSYAGRALAQLRLAQEKGLRNADDLKKDPDLEPIRAREDFRKLVADLDRKMKR
jgi:hypothetical protein